MEQLQKVGSVSEFLEQVKVLSKKIKSDDEISSLWFRGEPANTLTPLAPKAYRRFGGPLEGEDFTAHVFSQAKMLEGNVISTFIREATPLLVREGIPLNGWNEYYIMQHYGMSTRLLDWTESALLALFFAVKDHNEIGDSLVWILSPHNLNRMTIQKISGTFINCIYTPTNQLTKAGLITDEKLNLDELHRRFLKLDFEPREGGVGPSEYFPIAIYPPFLDTRMQMQKSCFTLFGNKVNGLITPPNKASFLNGIGIEASAKKKIKEELKILGINYKSVYPDLAGICRAIEDHYDLEDLILKKVGKISSNKTG